MSEAAARHRGMKYAPRAERLAQTEQLIKDWPRATPQQLADKIGVSLRTINRYKMELENRS